MNQDFETIENKKADLRRMLRKLFFIYKTLLMGYSVKMVPGGTNEIQFSKSMP